MINDKLEYFCSNIDFFTINTKVKLNLNRDYLIDDGKLKSLYF